MTWLIVLYTVGAITFSEQAIPGLEGPYPWNNFRHADLNGDTALDLILPTHVFFQQPSGLFDLDNPIRLPDLDQHPYCDLWGHELYLRYRDRLKILDWHDGQWRLRLDQAIAWPDADYPENWEQPDPERDGVRFAVFLHDFNADNRPEIIIMATDGLHILAMGEEEYRQTSVIDIYPQPRIEVLDAPLWPPDERQLAVPDQLQSTSFFLEGELLTTFQHSNMNDGYWVVSHESRLIDSKQNFAAVPGSLKRVSSPGISCDQVWPRRIAAGADFALIYERLLAKSGGLLPFRIFEVGISTDHGRSFWKRRARLVANPPYSLVDVNGDQRLDFVLHECDFAEGGVREIVSRLLSSKAFNHEVHIFLQRDTGQFPDVPDYNQQFRVTLGQNLFRRDTLFWRYVGGSSVSLDGDIDGNGTADLVLRDGPDRLAVFPSRNGVFASDPEAAIPFKRSDDFHITDVDGDGRDDIMCLHDYFEEYATKAVTVLFSREGER